MSIKGINKVLPLAFVSIVLIIFIISDMPEKIYLSVNNLIKEYKDIKSAYEAMSSNFKMKDQYEKRRTELLNEIKSPNYNTEIFQEDIISLINYNCIKNSISISNIVFPDIQSVGETGEDMELAGKEVTPFDIQRVTVDFKCSYKSLLLFIDAIKNENADIAIVNMRVVNWNGDIVYVTSDLNFYILNMETQVE